MTISILNLIVDMFHIIFMFIPFIVLLVPLNVLKKYILTLKIVFLLYILTPVHWLIFDNECILTLYSKKRGTLNNDVRNAFSKKYLSYIYYPILRLFNAPINDKYITRIIGVHWLLMLLSFWYVVCIKLN